MHYGMKLSYYSQSMRLRLSRGCSGVSCNSAAAVRNCVPSLAVSDVARLWLALHLLPTSFHWRALLPRNRLSSLDTPSKKNGPTQNCLIRNHRRRNNNKIYECVCVRVYCGDGA